MWLIKIFSVCFLLIALEGQSQTIEQLTAGNKTSIRGLSVVNDRVIWASGSGGYIARSVDGGKNFEWQKLSGYEKTDFRDIEAFDENTAIIMGIASPGILLKTVDGGKNWKKVYEDSSKEVFMDAMDFYTEKEGIVIGDPVNGKMYMVTTSDKGESWQKTIPLTSQPGLSEGEAFFASSGTNLRITAAGKKGMNFLLVTGGKKSRIFNQNFQQDSLPIMQGGESTGANSIAYLAAINRAVVVGGDFSKPDIATNNCVLVNTAKGFGFSRPQTPPHGYRSCVIYLSPHQLLTCGTTGVDLSNDGGENWELLTKDSYHVCSKAKNGKAVFLAGANGRIAKLVQ
ncbi:MAG: hypothetical protein RLZZ28_179 [Bacteroidota bacterium]